MTRSRGVQVLVGGAIISLFIAVGGAGAIDSEPTSATLTPEVLKQRLFLAPGPKIFLHQYRLKADLPTTAIIFWLSSCCSA
jgi:hypothetical protein